MKGLIVEIERKTALVMDKDGKIQRIPRKEDHIVGKEIIMEEKSNVRTFRLGKYALMAAALILTVGLSFYVWADRAVAAKINVDINPSVEVWLNNMGRVIKVVALNADGENLLSVADFKTSDPMAALKKIVGAAQDSGYFVGDQTDVIVVSIKAGSDKKTEELKASIDSQLNQFMTDEGIQAVTYVEKHFDDRIDYAKENGISPGKMLLIEKLLENKPDAVASDYFDSSIKDIVKEIIAVRKVDNANKPKDENIDELVNDTEKMIENKSNNASEQGKANQNKTKGNTTETSEVSATPKI